MRGRGRDRNRGGCTETERTSCHLSPEVLYIHVKLKDNYSVEKQYDGKMFLMDISPFSLCVCYVLICV